MNKILNKILVTIDKLVLCEASFIEGEIAIDNSNFKVAKEPKIEAIEKKKLYCPKESGVNLSIIKNEVNTEITCDNAVPM